MMPERTLGRIRSSMQRPVVSIPAAHRLGGEPTVGYQRRMDVSTLNGKTVLVTGAASGIGRETALACARRGARMVIANVASAAGYVASAQLAAYSTTKFAVVGLSEALRDELAQHGIGVTAICPGLINTPITRSARLRGPEASQNRERLVELYQRRDYGPERVAERILRAVQRNRAVAPISPEAWAMYYLKRLAPGALAWLQRVLTDRARRV